MTHINPTDLDKIHDALMSRDEAACLKAMALVTAAKDAQADAALIQRARDEYQTDDIEIDDLGVSTSEADEGTWVSAWVWLPHDEDEGEDADA